MIHTTIGNLGHLLVIVSFVTALVATYGYFQAVRTEGQLPGSRDATDWRLFSRVAFYVHTAAVVGIIAVLYSIIYQHQIPRRPGSSKPGKLAPRRKPS